MKRWMIRIAGLALLLSAAGELRSADTAIMLTPAEQIIHPAGQEFDLYLTLDSGVVGAHAYRVTFTYDTTVLRLDTIVPTPQWLAVSGLNRPFFYYQDSLDLDGQGQPIWYIDLFSAYLGQQYAINGYAPIARIRFASLMTGVSPIVIRSQVVQDSHLQFIVNRSENALVLVCPLPPGYVFFGDFDHTGTIDISDLTFLISYLFLFGSAPEPIVLAGDVTCDNAVDISDLTKLIDHLFITFSPLCDPCQ